MVERARVAARGPGTILCFHSVTPDTGVGARVHVTSRDLARAVQVAGWLGQVVPLLDLVERYCRGQDVSGLVALTFDDAYAALLTDRFVEQQVPFTVFAVSGALARGSRFWWDRVEELRPHLDERGWAEVLGASGLTVHGGARVTLDAFRRHVLRVCRGRLPAAAEARLAELEAALGAGTAQRSQTVAELRGLARHPWVSVGVHTVTHPVLPLLSDTELGEEIGGARDALREQIGGAVPVLAVPYGIFDERVARVAAETGMRATLGLQGRTLRGERRSVIPRFCAMRGESRWKQLLAFGGLVERVRDWRHAEVSPMQELEEA